MRIVTGAIVHETSTFTLVPTTWDNYKTERAGYIKGADILTHFKGVNTPTGGFIEGAEAHGFELIPTVHAEAHPRCLPPLA